MLGAAALSGDQDGHERRATGSIFRRRRLSPRLLLHAARATYHARPSGIILCVLPGVGQPHARRRDEGTTSRRSSNGCRAAFYASMSRLLLLLRLTAGDGLASSPQKRPLLVRRTVVARAPWRLIREHHEIAAGASTRFWQQQKGRGAAIAP